MNDFEVLEPITPPAPKKPHGAILHFFDMTEQALATVADTLSLSMGGDGLLRTRPYFAAQKRLPTVEELCFLDEIIRRRKSLGEAYRVSRTTKGHAQLSATREDLLQKLRALAPSFTGAISLADTATVASRYLDRIGVSRELPSLEPRESKPTEKKKLAPALSLILLLPVEEASYIESLNAMISESVCRVQVVSRGMVSRDGLALTLSEITNGACVGLSVLLDAERSTEEPLSILHGFAGTAWIAAQPCFVHSLITLAEAHGLRAVCFASTTESGKLTLAAGEAPYLSVDLAHLRALSGASFDGDFRLASVEEPNAPFFRAMCDATVAALLCYANGSTDRDAALSVTYRFARSAVDPESSGRNLEAILGVYRAQIELCITAEVKAIFEDGDSPTWEIAPLAPCINRLPCRRRRADTRTYLAPIPTDTNGMPDFAACRTLRRTLEGAAHADSLLALAVLNRDALTGIPAVENHFCAFLLESTAELPFAEITRIEGLSFFENEEEATQA